MLSLRNNNFTCIQLEVHGTYLANLAMQHMSLSNTINQSIIILVQEYSPTTVCPLTLQLLFLNEVCKAVKHLGPSKFLRLTVFLVLLQVILIFQYLSSNIFSSPTYLSSILQPYRTKGGEPGQCRQYSDQSIGWMIHGSNPGRCKNFFLFSAKSRQHEIHSPLPSLKKELSYTSPLPVCLHGTDRSNFTFYGTKCQLCLYF